MDTFPQSREEESYPLSFAIFRTICIEQNFSLYTVSKSMRGTASVALPRNLQHPFCTIPRFYNPKSTTTYVENAPFSQPTLLKISP